MRKVWYYQIWIQKYLGFTVSNLVYALILCHSYFITSVKAVMIVLRMFSSYKKMFRWNKKCFWHLIGGSGFLNWPSQEVLYRVSVSCVYTFSLSFKTRAFIPAHKWSANEMVLRNLSYLFVSVIFTKCFNFLICFVYFLQICDSQVLFVRWLLFWWFPVNFSFSWDYFFWLGSKQYKNADIRNFFKVAIWKLIKQQQIKNVRKKIDGPRTLG